MKPFLPLSLLTLAAGLGFAPAARADEPKPAEKKFEVEKVTDVPYYEGENADKVKHKLDLYLPKGHKDFPVLFFVHGGAWMTGDRNYFGVYSALGTLFARHGIGTVVTSYRLSPGVMHPEHVRDVARAFAWTHKNIAKHGGRPDQVFVCGHSAGGHLVALLATDEGYLKAEKLSVKDVKGAVPISGVYTIPDALASIFGKDAEVRKLAGPLHHCKEGCPPFLILYAEAELPGCDKAQAEAFSKALKDSKCQAETLEVKKRNHLSIITSASVEGDPTAAAILKFIADHTRQ